MTKLSFIVPVYNVAPYLRKCVDSLLAQDYDDYEIILVDDGSTDDSPRICDEYAASPLSTKGTSPFSEADHSIAPIRVIHQPNAGLSAARNAGIKCANGAYLCFVDSDDYWEPNVLGSLMEQVEREDLDVLRFDYQNVNERYEVYLPYKYPHQVDPQVGVVDGETYLNTRMGYTCYAVMYIMRRSIVPNFTEGIHFEDVDWLPGMMMNAKRVNSTIMVVYNYLIRQGSITQTQGSSDKRRRNIEDELYVLSNYKTYCEQYPNCQWFRKMQSSMAAGVLTTVACTFYDERKGYINRLRELNVFPLVIADQGKTYVRRARAINLLGAYMYCLIMRLR